MGRQNLSDLLFNEQNGEAPLFKSQSELSRLICLGPVERYQSEATVKVYLNKILKGNKPPSQDFKTALIRAVRERVEGRGNQGLYVSQVETALENVFKSSKDYSKQFHLESEFDAGPLRDCANHANHHVIIRDDPAELNRTGVAEKFKKLMLGNLGIGEGANTEDLKHYEFYVGTRKVGIQFWQSIFQYLIHNLKYKPDTARDLLRDLNNQNNIPLKSLRVYTILPIIAASRLSLYDIQDPQRRKAFMVNYDNKVSVSIVPQEKLEGILKDVFYEIRDPEKAILYQIKPVTFQMFVDQGLDVAVFRD